MFKVGDKVKVKKYCSGAVVDKIYKLTLASDGDLFATEESGLRRCCCRGNWILVESVPLPKIPLYKETGITKFLETTLRS